MSAGASLSTLLNKGNGDNSLPGLISRNVTVRDRRTSMRLEASMWEALKEICRRERVSASDICTCVAAAKSSALTLTAALRVFISNYFRDAATEEGHARAGHGVRIECFMMHTPFAGRRPVFLGDDETDIDAIDACTRLGGMAAWVGPDKLPGTTAFASPEAVRHWLAAQAS